MRTRQHPPNCGYPEAQRSTDAAAMNAPLALTCWRSLGELFGCWAMLPPPVAGAFERYRRCCCSIARSPHAEADVTCINDRRTLLISVTAWRKPRAAAVVAEKEPAAKKGMRRQRRNTHSDVPFRLIRSHLVDHDLSQCLHGRGGKMAWKPYWLEQYQHVLLLRGGGAAASTCKARKRHLQRSRVGM